MLQSLENWHLQDIFVIPIFISVLFVKSYVSLDGSVTHSWDKRQLGSRNIKFCPDWPKVADCVVEYKSPIQTDA